MRLRWILLLTLLSMGRSVAAAPPTFDDGETLETYLNEYRAYIDDQFVTTRAYRAEIAARMDVIRNEAEEEGANTLRAIPNSVDSGTSQTGRDGLSSFLSNVQLGIDSIEAGEEEGSFVVKWNPIRASPVAVGLSTIIRNAAPSDELLKQTESTSRKALEGAIESELSDLDDLTFSVRTGLERAGEDRGFGRNMETYEAMLAKHIAPSIYMSSESVERELSDCEVMVDQALHRGTATTVAWTALERGELQDILGPKFDDCVADALIREQGIVDLDRDLEPLHLLGFLVDNQPQLVASYLRHDRGELAGRDGWELSVEYEYGLCNLNKILNRRRLPGSGCGDDQEGLSLAELRGLQDESSELSARAQKGHKFTLSLRYAEQDELEVDRTFGEGDDAIDLDVNLPAAREESIKLQYSRNVTWQPRDLGDGEEDEEVTVYPKFHFSMEYTNISDDPDLDDRWVAQATYEYPLTESATLPLSLSYANHARYLGDVDDELSAHLGLSYSIDTKKPDKK